MKSLVLGAIRALSSPTFVTRAYVRDGEWQEYPASSVQEATMMAEQAVRNGSLFATVWRFNEFSQLTATWMYSFRVWHRMSDRPGFSDILRDERPHNDFA